MDEQQRHRAALLLCVCCSRIRRSAAQHQHLTPHANTTSLSRTSNTIMLQSLMSHKEEKERAAAALQEEARPVLLAIGLDEKVVE